MLAAITTGISSIKMIGDLLRGAKGISDKVKINEVLIEAQEHLLSLHQSLSSAQDTIDELMKQKKDLEQKVLEFEDWTVTEEEYRLTEIGSGIFVRQSSEETKKMEPLHWACANCFQEKKVSILQKKDSTESKIECPKCGFYCYPQ